MPSCPNCQRYFSTPQGLGLHFHHGCPKSKRAKWDGLCPAGKHGLDYRTQPCDLCAKSKRRKFIVALAFHSECCPHVHAELRRVTAASPEEARRIARVRAARAGIEVYSDVSIAVEAVEP